MFQFNGYAFYKSGKLFFLVEISHPNGGKVDSDNQKTIRPDPAQREKATAQKETDGNDTEQKDSEPGGKDISAMGFGGQRHGSIKQIQKNKNQQVKNATPQHVTGCNIGNIGVSDGAYSGYQFRKGSHRSQEDHAGQSFSKSGLLGNNITVLGQFYTRINNHQRASNKTGPKNHTFLPKFIIRHLIKRQYFLSFVAIG